MKRHLVRYIATFLTFVALSAVGQTLPPMYRININNVGEGWLLINKQVNLLYSYLCDANGKSITVNQARPGVTTFYLCESDPTRGAFGTTNEFSLNIDPNNTNMGCYINTTCHASYSGKCTGNIDGDTHVLSQGKDYQVDCPTPVVVQPSGNNLGSVTFTINIEKKP